MSTTETVTIHPTKGRNVYFNSPDGEYGNTECASIITAVKSEDVVSLVVFTTTGFYHVIDCVRGQGANQWDWMPYQKEQAARQFEAARLVGTVAHQTEPLPAVGENVLYVDASGVDYDAVVDHVWPSVVNLTYYMQCGGTNGATSVPPYSPGMTGNYFKRVDKAAERTDIPVEHIC
ncbi:hypothetical protein [Tumebacillus permanentifrigoris]|uniref:Uncharacterized protein n=1 Tax=Tumebacillus permanentifrigoris TaxID=378543 RepID=A0A316D317_9BACL|nr:hypothetical protein [Tumebacillus permanentifrigoris]PWK05321.1 hypothetical protein C7459_12470 [Tumebacillus permanentifrigoris]